MSLFLFMFFKSSTMQWTFYVNQPSHGMHHSPLATNFVGNIKNETSKVNGVSNARTFFWVGKLLTFKYIAAAKDDENISSCK
jgi:hypothetical protein